MALVSTRFHDVCQIALIGTTLLVTGPATAAITDLTLHGNGQVTYSSSDPSVGQYGPAIGTPVIVDVQIHLGTAGGDPGFGYAAAPADDFTGRYTISMDMVLDRYSTYSWQIDPADTLSSLDPANAFSGGTIDFVGGALTDFALFFVGDPDGHTLTSTTWAYDFGPDSPATWGGVWALDAAGPVPEPAAWSLMIAGFALVGAAARRRRGKSDSVAAWR